MASGCPCIAADTGGLREVVPHDEAGLRFRARDPHSLTEAVERVFSDHRLRERLIAEAADHVLRFDWVDVAERTGEVYGELVRDTARA
jgi:glycogen synthase